MTIERKVGMGIAGQPSGGPTDVAEVFSTYLYTGTGSAQTINNGIDLAGEGGLVWIKNRDSALEHILTDTERGANKTLHSDSTAAEFTASPTMLSSFTSTGFSVGTSNSVSYNNDKYASFTFRKKSGFFDCVTWTGNGVAGREISHGLNGPVGMMIVKDIDTSTSSWATYHKSLGATKYMYLEATGGANTHIGFWNDTEPTDSVFTIGSLTAVNNVLGDTYVAYLFADNSSEDAEDQMIKCGSYTGTAADLSINLGWEPQFLLIKNTTSAADWYMVDTMRGFTATSLTNEHLSPNSSNAEAKVGNVVYDKFLNSTGFNVLANASQFNTNNQTYIYMAIRAPMMVEPEAATDVFHVNASQGNFGSPSFYSTGFDVDMAITKNYSAGASYYNGSRFAGSGQFLRPDNTNAEDNGGPFLFDVSDGVTKTGGGGNGNDPYVTHMWKRAKGYMDVVAYFGADLSGGVVYHSLGVKPELVIIKQRNAINSANREWAVGSPDLLGVNANTLSLNNNYANGTLGYNMFNTTAGQTDTQIKLHGGVGGISGSSGYYIAYLFATLAGISKVGSYTGNGSNQTIDCGFSAGSRFILIKRTDAVGDWYFWDSARGIVAGNDPHLSLNNNTAQVTTDDSVDPANAGFIVNQNSTTNINVSSGTYIFYAIA